MKHLNLDHVLSFMNSRDGKRQVLETGEQLVTNGNFMVKLPADVKVPIEMADFKPLADLWPVCLKIPVAANMVGLCYLDSPGTRSECWGRSISPVFFIQEVFYRCFSADCTWTTGPDTAKARDMAFAHLHGELVGVVMRFKMDLKAGMPPGDPTDSELFAPLADDHNNWYLIDEKTIRKHVDEAEKRLTNAQYKMRCAEEQVDDCEDDLSSVRQRLGQFLNAGSATPPKPGPSAKA